MGKSFGRQYNLRKLENLEFGLFDRKMNRREFLYIGLAIGSILGGIGLWRFLLPKRKEEEKTTSSPTPTPTETTTTTTSPTPTQTITETPTSYPPRLSKANFTKTYSSKGLNVVAWLEFDKKILIKNAKLSFPIFGPLLVPLSKVEENVYRGECLIERPKPVDYKAVWDAETKEGIKASEMIPEEERTLKMKMPLEDYDSTWKKEKLDELFSISILSYPKDPEKIFLTAYQLANKTGRRPKRSESLQTLANYSIALEQGLPFIEGHELLLDACEKNPEIVDFSPINVSGQAIQSKNIPRDTWMIAEHLRRTSYVVDYPSVYLAFSIKLQQNAWDILDNPQMHELGEYYKPTDEIIWSKVIIPQWEYYWNSSPQSENSSKRICVFPWYDSSLLEKQISNTTDRKIALMYFWELLPVTSDLDRYLKMDWKYEDEVFIKGLNAMIYQVEQMSRLYDKIVKEYPNGTWLNPYTKRKIPYINFFYAEITDVGYHGLNRAMKQFLGPNIIEEEFIPDLDEQYIKKNPESINTYLSKNYSDWRLIKFICGYRCSNWSWEGGVAKHALKIALNSFGIPCIPFASYYEHYINAPARYAVGENSAVLGLPDYVIKSLKEGNFDEFLVYPGNGINPVASPIKGVKEDLDYGQENPVEPNAKYMELYLPIRGNRICLFRKGKRG